MVATLTLSSRLLLAVIENAADDGIVCPSNMTIGDILQWNPDTVQKNIAFLERAGVIEVEVERNRRIVTIIASGKRTADPPKRMYPNKSPSPRRRVEAPVEPPEANYVKRDPCFACGVPYDRHDALGCKRWRA